MKHTVTDLKGSNEPISFAQQELGVCFLEAMMGFYESKPSPIPPNTQLELQSHTLADENEIYTIYVRTLDSPVLNDKIWTLHYDGSKNHDGSGAGCILVDPKRNIFLISCRLEFQCTNNTIEYEASILSLKKYFDLKVECLKVIGNSEIITRQARNTIHCF